MKTTIAICAAGLLLAAVLIVWQARALVLACGLSTVMSWRFYREESRK